MNSLLKKLQAGRTGYGLFADMDSALVTRSVANVGMDFVFIDQQHGLIDSNDVDHMITPLIGTDCTPIVRVATNDDGLIMGALDRGALGVVCPLVNTAEEAKKFVHALRYPPEGGRSWGPMKPGLYYGSDYTQKANGNVMAIAQIETKQAVENLDAILSTEGLDAILVGPNDLGFTYGNQPMSMPEDQAVRDAIKLIADTCRKKNVYAGIHCGDTAMAKEMIKWGYQFMSIGTDFGYLTGFAQNVLEEMKR
ncbi:HpcH/HpaI aldolase family protein [Curvivirga sp.]|uniref:HpcH/HpaI aldolase family protein n=1 Tax=Curvivirga sp. TaxID=2856848 RepID=UPI003B5C81E5